MNLILLVYLACLANFARAQYCSCSGSSVTEQPVATTTPTVGKRGLAYNDAQLANIFQKRCRACAWAYNWGWKDNGLLSSVEFVPMLWNESTASELQNNLPALRGRGLKYILGFNEPDHYTQSNMRVERAVDSHIKYLNMYSDVARIGSPAVTSQEPAPGSSDDKDNPKGHNWLRDFLDLCRKKGCKLHFCAIHWYGDTSQADRLIKFLRDAHSVCPDKPLWLTEFNATGSSDEVISFMEKVLPVLDNLPYLQRYAWFMAAMGNLLQSPDTLSAYGTAYASL